MKAQVIILTLFFVMLGYNGFAKTNAPQNNEQKNVVKNNYDFTIFKFYSISSRQQKNDSIALKENLIELKRKID